MKDGRKFDIVAEINSVIARLPKSMLLKTR